MTTKEINDAKDIVQRMKDLGLVKHTTPLFEPEVKQKIQAMMFRECPTCKRMITVYDGKFSRHREKWHGKICLGSGAKYEANRSS